MNFIAFDLEGPLSSQENAYELMKLFPEGDKIFEIISRYDELLALEERADYEPGDLLALIVPFLALHNVKEDSITTLAAEASITSGAEKLISWLEYGGWRVFCITTAYEQYALHITHKLGIFAHNLACTSLSLAQIQQTLTKEDSILLQQVEQGILTMSPMVDDNRIKKGLDDFLWQKLPATNVGKAIKEVKPVGGQRKVAALQKFADKYTQDLSRWVVVGDGIADFRMLQTVEEKGGLAIAFNASKYALPYSTMSLASTSITDLTDVLAAWPKGQRKAVEIMVREKERIGGAGDRGHFHWLSGRGNMDDVIKVHQRIRRLVRE